MRDSRRFCLAPRLKQPEYIALKYSEDIVPIQIKHSLEFFPSNRELAEFAQNRSKFKTGWPDFTRSIYPVVLDDAC